MYVAGYVEGTAYDPERSAWRADMPRPLEWAAWYPSQCGVVEISKLIGRPGAELFTMGAVAQSAPLNEDVRQWPVALLSHGTGGSAQGLAWLGRRLASKGYVAISVSHHGNTAIEPYLPEGFLCWWERARDLTVLLDFLNEDSMFSGRLDMTNVFAAGFSLGGYTVLSLAGAITSLDNFDEWLGTQKEVSGPREFPDLARYIPELTANSEPFRQSQQRHGACFRDRRIKAVMALAPAPPVRSFTPESIATVSVPVAIMVGQNDREAPHEDCALWLKQLNPAFQLTLLGCDVGHYVFLPEATELGEDSEPEICRDRAGVERRAIHDIAADAAEALYRRAGI